VPGDLVSVYATAKDANSVEAHTDMMFIQADPFEREFTQSQEQGGGGEAAVVAAAEEINLRRFRNAKRKLYPPRSSNRETRTLPNSRLPKSPNCCRNPKPHCMTRP